MAEPVDALHEGVGPEDPWLALLLGCVAWSRSLARGVGAGDPAPGEARDAGAARRAEPALLALLGLLALDRRLRVHLGEIDVTGADPPARPFPPPRGLLR